MKAKTYRLLIADTTALVNGATLEVGLDMVDNLLKVF